MTTALTLHELEAESVELLPTRETLCGCYRHPSGQSQNNLQVGLVNVNNSFNNLVNIGGNSNSGNQA